MGSCNSVRILVASVDVFMPFPGEERTLTFLKDMSVSVMHNSTQVDLQAVLDDTLFKQLVSSSSVRDQARVHALSHSSCVSSGWLKALPQDLAFSCHDISYYFTLMAQYSFVPLPLCSCLSMINQLVIICWDALMAP